MVKLKVLKTIVDSQEFISSEIQKYHTKGSMEIIKNDGDWTILEAFGVDRKVLVMYQSLGEACTIDGIFGVVEVNKSTLSEVWATEKVDGVVREVLVEDAFVTSTKGDKSLLHLGYKTGGSTYEADEKLLREFVARFTETEFANYYCTKDTMNRKVWGYSIDKAGVLDMLKATLEAWMIERGLDKLMSNFNTALKAELQTFVVEYYYL